MPHSITVAFSTFRETYLEWVIELLQALEKQTMEDFGVIAVVTGNKSYFEKLLDVIKESETEIGREVQVIFCPLDRGIAHSRNLALKHTRTPYIAYTDDDAIPHPHWLEELMCVLESNGKVGAVTGPVLCRWLDDAEDCASWFPQELYWLIGCTSENHKREIVVRNGLGSNLALKREILLSNGGFNESFGYNPRDPISGEESELGIRLARSGYVTLWNPNAIVYHRVFKKRLELRNILVRSFIEGKTKACLSKVYGGNTIKREEDHLQSVLKRIIRARSFRSKALLLLTTIGVLSGYLAYRTHGL